MLVIKLQTSEQNKSMNEITITKNTLRSKSSFPRLQAEDALYSYKFLYIGDNYENDCKNHAITTQTVALTISPKKQAKIDLLPYAGHVSIDFNSYYKLVQTQEDLDNFYEICKKSMQSIENINRIYQEYFGQYIKAK